MRAGVASRVVRAAAVGLLAIAAAVAAVAAGGPAAAAPRVDQQAWAQTGPATTFMPRSGELYVATSAGIEEARSFVHVDVSGVGAEQLATATLALREASDGLLPAGADLVACALAAPFTGDGKLAGAGPAADCTLRTRASRDANGTWNVELGVFAARWASGDNNGLVVFPDTQTGSTYRVAFAADRSELLLPATAAPAGANGSAAGSAAPPSPETEAPSPPVIVATTPSLEPLGVFASGPPPTSPPALAARPPVVQAPLPVAVPAAGPQASVSSALSPPGRSTTRSSVVAMLWLAIAGAAIVAVTSERRAHRESAAVVTDERGAPRTTPAARQAHAARLLVVLGLAALPMFFHEVTVYKLGVVLIFFVGAIGLHVLVNWAGQLSLAHAAMIGVPGFGLLALSASTGISPIYLLPVAVVLGMVVGAVVALPTLRAKDLQVAVVTLVAGIALIRFFSAQTWLVGSAGGRASAVPALGPLRLTTSRSLYPVLALIVAGAALAARALMHSKVARAWYWVRADPDAAAAFGVPVVTYRIAAYAIGGAFAGLAGGLSVMWIQRLDADAFPATLSFAYLLIAVLAGPGLLGGLAVATAMLQGGQQFASNAFGSGGGKTVDTILTYGGPLALIAVIARYQEGFNGLGRRLMARMRTLKVPLPRRRDDAAAEGVSVSIVVGTVAIAAGFLAMALAWRHISRTDQLWVQNQEILSGGLVGLGLILVGVGLLIRDRLARNHALLVRELGHLVDARRRDADVPEPAVEQSVVTVPVDPAPEPAVTAANGRARPRTRAVRG